MSPIPETPTAGTSLRDEWKQIVVCSYLLAPTHRDEALFYDICGGLILYQFIELQLHHHGVELFGGPKRNIGTALQLSDALAWFKVRDVAKAGRAIVEGLELLPIKAFLAVAWFDTRENLWRVLWPEKPLFDPHRVIARNIENITTRCADLSERFSRYHRELAAAHSTPPPDAPPQ